MKPLISLVVLVAGFVSSARADHVLLLTPTDNDIIEGNSFVLTGTYNADHVVGEWEIWAKLIDADGNVVDLQRCLWSDGQFVGTLSGWYGTGWRVSVYITGTFLFDVNENITLVEPDP